VAIQAANVLASTQAAEIGIYVVRAFVHLREALSTNTDVVKRLAELEMKTETGPFMLLSIQGATFTFASAPQPSCFIMPSMNTVASSIKAWISGNKSGNITHVVKRLLDVFLTKKNLQVLAQRVQLKACVYEQRRTT
jgi:hypothetical protein